MRRSGAAALAMVCTGASIDQLATQIGKSTRTRWVRSPCAPTTAHGRRRGFINAALAAGRRPDEIMAHTRHASLSAFGECVQAAARWSDPIRLP